MVARFADLEKRMREAAGNLEFEEAGRMRDEIKRLQSVALAIGDDPMARQMDIEATAGSYAGERPFGRAANLPSTRPRKPTDADMGPHNWAITAITVTVAYLHDYAIKSTHPGHSAEVGRFSKTDMESPLRLLVVDHGLNRCCRVAASRRADLRLS